MKDAVSLARRSRILLALAGLTHAFTGLWLFLLPEYAADVFAWDVSPLVATTVGAWTLGVGLMALDAVRGIRRHSIADFYPQLLFVWSFSVLELLVIVAFAGQLRTDNWLTWPYLIGLGLGLASAALGVPALWRMRAEIAEAPGFGMPPSWLRGLYVVLVVLTLGLAAGALVRGAASDASFFPEPLSAFSTIAFGALCLSIGLGALPLLVSREMSPLVEYARSGFYLVLLVALAAILNLDVFDFAVHPGGLVYLGICIGAGLAAVSVAAWHRGQFEPS